MEPPRRLAIAAGGAIAATAIGTWFVAGVGFPDVVLFLGYVLAWTVLPGLGLLRLLHPEAAGLERLVVGWALGYAASIAAFHLTAAVDLRALFYAVPLLALPLLARGRRRAAEPLPAAAVAGLAAVASLAIVFQALAFAPLAPLPGTSSAAYPPDPMFHLAVAAEALHHFPVTDPKVSGTPLPYHLFAHYDVAGAAQVTRVELPVVAFRLAAVPLLVLGTLAVGLLALRAGAFRVGVPLAAALFLFAGEIDLQPRIPYPFWGGTFFGLTFSPSFLLAVPLFGALLAVVLRIVTAPGADRGLWAAAALLAWGVGGAKGGSLAVVVGACALYAVARRDRRALALAGLAAAVAAVQLVVVYGGAGEGNLEIRVLGAARSSSAVDALANWLAVIGPLGTLLAIGFGVVALLAAPVVGAFWAPRDRGHAWLLLGSAFAAGLVPLLLLTHRGESQLYLTQLGLVGATALAGAGLERLFARACVRAVLLGACWSAALLVLAFLPGLTGTEGPDAHAIWYGGLVALGTVVLLATRSARSVALVVVLAAAVNVPLDTIAPLARARANGTTLSAGDDVTPALHEGLVWIRGHTPTDAVLAVNVHDTNRGRFDNFVTSALAERRVFLEGWLYSILARDATPREVARGLEQPFPERKRLNDEAFAGDRVAARTLADRYGVRYLLVDKLHGSGERARGLGRLVFSNAALDVVELG